MVSKAQSIPGKYLFKNMMYLKITLSFFLSISLERLYEAESFIWTSPSPGEEIKFISTLISFFILCL